MSLWAQELAPKWAMRPAGEVLRDPAYWRDVLAAGPRLGMTFMVEAARDVPVQEATK